MERTKQDLENENKALTNLINVIVKENLDLISQLKHAHANEIWYVWKLMKVIDNEASHVINSLTRMIPEK